MPDLSIIILNWNTRTLLEQCLESIYANAPRCSFEIIVVDNNSIEEISGINERFGEIRLIRNRYNYGFAVGNNIGFIASTGRYVMTLNPDTLVFPGTIDRLIEQLEKDETVGISVPSLKGKRSRRGNHTFFHLYLDSIVLRNIANLFERYRNSEEEPFDVEFIGGTGYICRRSALSIDKIFREDYFLFGEEYQLCREMAAKHFKIRVVPDAKIEHFTSVTFKNDLARLQVASRLGMAVLWNIRNDRFGIPIGTLFSLFLGAEQFSKLILLRLGGLLRSGQGNKYEKLAAQSRVVVSSILPLLTNESEHRKRVNTDAELFFNNGERPAKIRTELADRY